MGACAEVWSGWSCSMDMVNLREVTGIRNPVATRESTALYFPYSLRRLLMKIGNLATASAPPGETIRYYEREGILPKPGRTLGNYRVYEENHLERLQFVRYCRGLDMSLDEVRVLLRLKDS